MMQFQETRMDDGKRGVPDLDIFEGLGKKTPGEPATPAPPAAAPPAGAPPAPVSEDLSAHVTDDLDDEDATRASHATDDVDAHVAATAKPASVPPSPAADSTPSLDGMVALGDLLPRPATTKPAPLEERPFSPLLLDSVPPPPPVASHVIESALPPTVSALEESAMPPPGRDALPSLSTSAPPVVAGAEPVIPPPPPSDMETTNALPPVQPKGVRIEGDLTKQRWDDDQQATLVFDRAKHTVRSSPSNIPPAEGSAQLLSMPTDPEPERANIDQIMTSPPPPAVAEGATTGETESFTVPKLPDIAPLLGTAAAPIASDKLAPPAEATAVLSAPAEAPAPALPGEDDRSLSGAFALLGTPQTKAGAAPAFRPPPPPPPGRAAAPVPMSAPLTSPSPAAPPPPQAVTAPMTATPAPVAVGAPVPSPPGSPITAPMYMPEPAAPHAPVTTPSALPGSSPSVHVHPSAQHPSSSRVPSAPPVYGAPPAPGYAAPPPAPGYGPPPAPAYAAPPAPGYAAPAPGYAPPPAYARSHAPSPGPMPMPPISRSLEATHTIKRSDSRTQVFAVFAVVLALAAGATFFMMPRPGALVINAKDDKGAAIPKLTIEVDGAKKCEASPCNLAEVEPGTHKVKVTAPGFEVQPVRDVVVDEKQSVTADFTFVPSKPPPGQGFKVSGSYPGLKVTVDGRELGQLGTEVDLDAGPHKIHFAGDRYEPMDKSIIVDPGKLVDFGALGVKVTKGKATITLETPGAKVYLVDGSTKKEVPQSPMAIEFGPNEKWELLATKDGFVDYKQPISFADGEAEKIFNIALTPKNPKAPSPSASSSVPTVTTAANEGSAAEGVLKLNSLPASTVSVDGKSLGMTPQAHVSVTPGSHTVTFVNADESLKKTITVDVKAGETKAAFAKLRE